MQNAYVVSKSRFPLGELYVTTPALRSVSHADITAALNRHANGDWGDVCEDDRSSNELALTDSSRLMSVYHDPKGVTFWIITEWDRSVTTVLLPDDY